MERPGRRTAAGLLVVISALTVVAAAFVLEGIFFKHAGVWPWVFRAREQAPVFAKVTYVQKFTRCGDAIATVRDMPKEEVAGLLAALAPGWRVTWSEDSNVEVQRDLDDFCPEHRDYRFVVLYRDSPAESLRVCVFRGKKIDPAFLVREITDLTEDRLYPRERAELRAGVLVPDPQDTAPGDVDEKVAAYLQGIAEGR